MSDLDDDDFEAEDDIDSLNSIDEMDEYEISKQLNDNYSSNMNDSNVMYGSEYLVINDDNRRTSNMLSVYEMTEIVSIRSSQISKFDNCMVAEDLIKDIEDPIVLAKMELMKRKCPLTLRRHVGIILINQVIKQVYEYWNPNEMAFAIHYDL